MTTDQRGHQLYVIGVSEKRGGDDTARLTFNTTRGDMGAVARICHGTRQGVVLLGENNDDASPESTLFAEVSEGLRRHDISSIRVDYRFPGDCAQCAIDALLACQYLDDEGVSDILLMGWSFGGAVAIAAGAVARNVSGVAAISVPEVPDCCIRRLQDKPLLLIHGESDEVTPAEAARRVHQKFGPDARLIIYPGEERDLAGVRPRLYRDLMGWAISSLQLKDAAAHSLAN